jgi:hypothetical protein
MHTHKRVEDVAVAWLTTHRKNIKNKEVGELYLYIVTRSSYLQSLVS